MAKATILVGTVGQGIMRSRDDGATWQRVGIGQGMHSDAMVRTLLNHPQRPEIIYAGTEKGLYRSDDGGEKWRLVESPLSNHAVWALAIDPEMTEVMFAGTGTPTPATVFRSTDAGATWEERPAGIAEVDRRRRHRPPRTGALPRRSPPSQLGPGDPRLTGSSPCVTAGAGAAAAGERRVAGSCRGGATRRAGLDGPAHR